LTRRTLFAASAALAQARPKNILLIVADDLGRNLGCYGDPNARTPHLDRFAAEGTRFDNAFATTASCSPSRSVMLTGLYNHTNGQYGLAQGEHNFHLRANVVPLARTLKQSGYRTGVIGKFHVNPASAFAWDLRAEGDSFDPEKLNATTRQFLNTAGTTPWYLHIGFGDPHRGPGGRFRVDKPAFDAAQLRVPSYLPDTPQTRADLADYYTAIERFDRGVGLLRQTLQQTGQLDNTLLVIISDNGPPMPNAKTTLYDAGVRLPMLVRAPGVSPSVQRAMVSFTDLVPTFLDWSGAQHPAKLPGRSVLPLLGREDSPGWDEVYLSHTFHGVSMYYPMRGMRTRQYKYLLNLAPELTYPHATDLSSSPTWQGYLKLPKGTAYGRRNIEQYLHRPAEELYDVSQDLDEIHNLATRPEDRATLESLRRKVQTFRQQTADPWLK
jgi:N-sulfoglucosamine sulfohydrolase